MLHKIHISIERPKLLASGWHHVNNNDQETPQSQIKLLMSFFNISKFQGWVKMSIEKEI